MFVEMNAQHLSLRRSDIGSAPPERVLGGVGTCYKHFAPPEQRAYGSMLTTNN